MAKLTKRTGLLIAFAGIVPSAAYGQAPETTVPGPSQAENNDIIVTATRRSSALQTTPIAITALSQQDMIKAGVTDANSLMRVLPSVQVIRNVGAPAIYIRGIGLQGTVVTSEAGVAVHLNGIYLARPESIDAAFFDLQQVEVLRGPQGTLYGRNATGGAVNFITALPGDQFDASGTVEIGNYDHIRVEGAISGPVGGGLKVRLAGFSDSRDGYTTNLSSGAPLGKPRTRGGRLTLAWEPEGSIFSSVLVADYISTKGAPIVARIRDRYPAIPGIYVPTPSGRSSSDPFEVYTDIPNPFGEVKLHGGSLVNTIDLGAASIKSITGYRYSRRSQFLDTDGTDAPNNYGDRFQKSNTFSQEVQLASQGDHPFQYLIGLFYFREHVIGTDEIFLRQNLGTVQNPVLFTYLYSARDDQITKSYAGYGEISYQLTPHIKAIAGLRYGKDEKTDDAYQRIAAFNVNASILHKDSWSALTPKFVLQYQDSNLFLYASATRGYKAGGFNNVQPESYDPEFIWTYEGGVKKNWLDRAVQTNLAVFYSDYTDLQVTQFISNRSIQTNAGKSRIQGFELETIVRPAEGLTLSGNLNYLDSYIRIVRQHQAGVRVARQSPVP
jgi:iron complex outermembrane receptor protein